MTGAQASVLKCGECGSVFLDPWEDECGLCGDEYVAHVYCERCGAVNRVEGDICGYCNRDYCDRCKKPGEASECKPCGDIRDDQIGAEAILRNAIREAVRA